MSNQSARRIVQVKEVHHVAVPLTRDQLLTASEEFSGHMQRKAEAKASLIKAQQAFKATCALVNPQLEECARMVREKTIYLDVECDVIADLENDTKQIFFNGDLKFTKRIADKERVSLASREMFTPSGELALEDSGSKETRTIASAKKRLKAV